MSRFCAWIALLFSFTIGVLSSNAFAQQGVEHPTSPHHFRQHPQIAAPHRPVPRAVPAAKRRPLPAAKAGSVIGGIWMTDANFKSRLYLRSIIATASVTVKPIMYLSNGTKIPLADVILEPDGVAVIDLNNELAKQGISSFATLSGYVEVQYNWPWNPICAMVRALDPVHSLLFYYSLQPSLHVASPKFKPGQAIVQPPAPQIAAHAVEGLWWKQESNVTGFVGLANTTAQPLTATVTVSDQQSSSIAQHSVTISPHGMKLVDLPELASASTNSGGITVTYTGLRDDLLVDGALQDPATGYSAMLPFMFVGTELPDTTQTSVAELGLMVGTADSMMKFPADTIFTPYSVVRNISDTPVTANPTLWWMEGGSAQYADIPAISLAPHQSQLLDMSSILASAGLSNFTGSVNLVFDIQAKPGSLLFSAGSIDKRNTYVFAVYPRGVTESASKSLSYWSTGNGDNTMVTLWNPSDETQDLVFRFNYPGGHYDLPIQLAGRATRNFNVSEIIASQVPDAEGNVIPASVHEGSGVIMGAGGKPQHILLAADAATYNVSKATCGSICWSCDGYAYAWIDLDPFGVTVNSGQTQEYLQGMYDDSWQGDLTSEADWWSDNNSVMTVSSGMVTGHALGTANIYGFASFEPIYNPNFCCQSCLYCDQGVGAGGGGSVSPTISGPHVVWWFNGLNPSPSTYPTSITLSTSGTATWSVTNGASEVHLSSTSGQSITVTGTGTFSQTANDVTITATVNGVTSPAFGLSSDGPKFLSRSSRIDFPCDGSLVGWDSQINYTLRDNLNNAMPNIPVDEAFSGSTVWPQPVSTPGTTSGSGTFTDDIHVCLEGSASPTPTSPQDPLSNTLVDSFNQTWCAGESISNVWGASCVGAQVQNGTLKRFIDHGDVTVP